MCPHEKRYRGWCVDCLARLDPRAKESDNPANERAITLRPIKFPKTR